MTVVIEDDYGDEDRERVQGYRKVESDIQTGKLLPEEVPRP